MCGCVLAHPGLFLIMLLLGHTSSSSMLGIVTFGVIVEVTYSLGLWVPWKQGITSSLIVPPLHTWITDNGTPNQGSGGLLLCL
jgi:hypothetical protein